jgi:diacylglycerol O-acyltransferase / wax synthase
MEQLSGLDASFLYLETPQMPMHVGALHLFELPAGTRGRFVTALRKHIAARLPLTPVLRRRLWWMPLNLANPAWVDANPDLKQHIVEVKLPPSARVGSGLAELEAEVSRLHTVLLDRSRPLWKFHVFEGLAPSADGHRRVALYTQMHHAAVDGQAAVALANAILDLRADAPAPQTHARRRPKTFRLEMAEMLRGALGNQVQIVSEIVRKLPSTVGTLRTAAAQAVANSALLGGAKRPSNLALAPRTALNVSVTSGRAFACVSLPLAEAKAIGRAHDATINDIVLLLAGGALRRYFARKHTLPRKSLIAAVPISLRARGDTSADNQASIGFVNLGTHIADVRRRLAHVKAATGAMKSKMGSVKSILPTDFPSLGVPWLIEALTALYGRAKIAERIPQLANVAISNVAGPPVPLYMAGARMTTYYPASIVVHGMALNITVQSYDQSLDFGLMADAQAVPDVRALADEIAIAFDDLRALPLGDEAEVDSAVLGQLVGKATRRITGAVGRAARQVVDTAVGSALSRASAPMRRRRGG